MPKGQLGRSQCTVDGCGRFIIGRGFCGLHYQRWAKHGDPLQVTLQAPSPANARFWPKVDKTPGLGPDGDCWEWIGSRNRSGYGNVRHNGKGAKAHRVSWEMAYGPIPKGLHVRHLKCDNPPCVRPEHLALGTVAANMRDRDSKGRRRPPGGERNGMAKLTAAQVADIRAIYSRQEANQRELAERFAVGSTTISEIVRGAAWTH